MASTSESFAAIFARRGSSCAVKSETHKSSQAVNISRSFKYLKNSRKGSEVGKSELKTVTVHLLSCM